MTEDTPFVHAQALCESQQVGAGTLDRLQAVGVDAAAGYEAGHGTPVLIVGAYRRCLRDPPRLLVALMTPCVDERDKNGKGVRGRERCSAVFFSTWTSR